MTNDTKEVGALQKSEGVNVNDLLNIPAGKIAAENPSGLIGATSSIQAALSRLSNQKPPNNELIARLNAKLSEIENALKETSGPKAGAAAGAKKAESKEGEVVAPNSGSSNKSEGGVGIVVGGEPTSGLTGGDRHSSFNFGAPKEYLTQRKKVEGDKDDSSKEDPNETWAKEVRSREEAAKLAADQKKDISR